MIHPLDSAQSTADWPLQALQQSLCDLQPGWRVEVLPRLASTNTCLMDRLRQAERPLAPCVLVAEAQTAGRGRLGRSWHATPGASLTFSLALPLAPATWSGLSLAVGVALADALALMLPAADPPQVQATPAVTFAPSRIGLKWPNDLWLMDGPVSGRKLGGILVETLSSLGARWVVVGVGLNVQAQDAQALDGLAVASLSEVLPGAQPPAVLGGVLAALLRTVLEFEQSGFAPFAKRYQARDVLQGRCVTLTQGEITEGRAQGVSDDGALRIQSDRGLVLVHGGEVSVRLAPDAAVPLPSTENAS